MAAQREFPVVPDISRSQQNEFRQLRKMIYDAQDALTSQQATIQNLNLNSQLAAPVSAPASSPSPATASVSASVISSTSGVTTNQQQSITSASGSNPNVTQLIGLLAQAQRAFIPEYSALPILADPASQNGSLISLNGVLYRFNGTSQPGTWEPQAAQGVISQDIYANFTAPVYAPAAFTAGSLFLISDWDVLYVLRAGAWAYATGTYKAPAASRPTTGFNGVALGTADTGLEFLATDTLVYSWWTGTAWSTVFPTGAAAGTYGDATHTVTLTVDANQRITAITVVPITFPPTVGFTGTLATAITAGKNVTNGLIDV